MDKVINTSYVLDIDLGTDYVDVYISRDYQKTWNLIEADVSVSATSGSYDWTVSVPYALFCNIKIVDSELETVLWTSDMFKVRSVENDRTTVSDIAYYFKPTLGGS